MTDNKDLYNCLKTLGYNSEHEYIPIEEYRAADGTIIYKDAHDVIIEKCFNGSFSVTVPPPVIYNTSDMFEFQNIELNLADIITAKLDNADLYSDILDDIKNNDEVVMRMLKEEFKLEIKDVSPNEQDYTVICNNEKDLDKDCILKCLSIMELQMATNFAQYHIDYIECRMTPIVKDNLILANKKLAMYGKEPIYIACFDDYGRRLPDEIKLHTKEGVNLEIVDPEEYGEFYLELRGIAFDKDKVEPPF